MYPLGYLAHPPHPPSRSTEVTQGSKPHGWGGVREKRGEERGGKRGEERAVWPPHQLVVRKTFRRVDVVIPT